MAYISILDFIQANLIPIGLIILSPAIYRLVYSITLFLAEKFINTKKDIYVKHYHDGHLKEVTIIKADITQKIEHIEMNDKGKA